MDHLRHGFVISGIKCSGCSFNGRIRSLAGQLASLNENLRYDDPLHPDLQLFSGMKEELFTAAFNAHQASREKCSGGRMVVQYAPAVSIFMDGKG